MKINQLEISDRVTDKEMETIILVIRGFGMEEIAKQLQMSVSGVKCRIRSINIKHGMKTKAGIEGLREFLSRAIQ